MRGELEWHTLYATGCVAIKPFFEGHGEIMGQHAVALPRTAELLARQPIGPKAFRNGRRCTAEVDELGRDQYAVYARIASDVSCIWSSLIEAVVRVCLSPDPADSMVDIVTVQLLEAPIQDRPLAEEPGIVPVCIVVQDLADLHGVDQVPGQLVLRFGARSDDPVADGRSGSDLRLAGRERAVPVERIRSEPVVTRHDIREQFHQQL